MSRIADKADYVRGKLRTDRRSEHRCHWPGCPEIVPAAAWGCRKHWYMLPLSIRNRIWGAFRPGQEDDKTPSQRYLAAAMEARRWIRDNHP